jgi:hypothetical protein
MFVCIHIFIYICIVSVLIMSRKWMTAVHAALKTNRRDLLEEEIGPAARTSARDMIKVGSFLSA